MLVVFLWRLLKSLESCLSVKSLVIPLSLSLCKHGPSNFKDHNIRMVCDRDDNYDTLFIYRPRVYSIQ